MTDKELISALMIMIASLLKENDTPFDIPRLREKVKERDNIECIDLIDRWVKSERGRDALKRLLIDDATVDTISGELNLSSKQTSRVIKKAGLELYAHVS